MPAERRTYRVCTTLAVIHQHQTLNKAPSFFLLELKLVLILLRVFIELGASWLRRDGHTIIVPSFQFVKNVFSVLTCGA